MTSVAMAGQRAEVKAAAVFAALLRRDMRVARRECLISAAKNDADVMFVVVFGF